MTILREWRGRAKPENAQAALQHYLTNMKPLMTGAKGFISASVASRDIGGLVEFVLITKWADIEAIKAFAGPAPERAVLPKGITDLLEDSDNFTRLFEVIDEV